MGRVDGEDEGNLRGNTKSESGSGSDNDYVRESNFFLNKGGKVESWNAIKVGSWKVRVFSPNFLSAKFHPLSEILLHNFFQISCIIRLAKTGPLSKYMPYFEPKFY